jgi:hypothetical protein
MAKDLIRPLKFETPENGGTQLDIFPTEVNTSQDYINAKGFAFESSQEVFIEKITNDMIFNDLNVNVQSKLEQLVWGEAYQVLPSGIYCRVLQGQNHIVFQETEIQGEYDIVGELVILD